MAEHRILVIEDQEDLAELYESSLEKAGYAVTVAYTGEEGVAEFEVCQRLGVQEYLSKPPDYGELLAALERALAHPQRDEQYMVVTVRLPARILQLLTDIDPNLERAITRVCEDCVDQLKTMSAANKG
ncbi:MAG: hypothetical protein LC800_05920 [Acidobacteria bacterium]|nr:hypothetical protein [Acidobacteriota bacterium]